MWGRMEARGVTGPCNSTEVIMVPVRVGTVQYLRRGHILPRKKLGRGWKAVLGSRGQGGLRKEGPEVETVWSLAESRSCGTGSGCCTPMCPRGLLEEECRTLEREIPILQVSCSPGPPLPTPQPFY